VAKSCQCCVRIPGQSANRTDALIEAAKMVDRMLELGDPGRAGRVAPPRPVRDGGYYSASNDAL
jgi:hypothetical protein